MTIDAVSEMTNNALYVIIKVSLPVLLVSLVVGLVISIFQTVTSIQEQTLTFVPKIVAIFLCLVVIGHWWSTRCNCGQVSASMYIGDGKKYGRSFFFNI